jgi:hypothetical protein
MIYPTLLDLVLHNMIVHHHISLSRENKRYFRESRNVITVAVGVRPIQGVGVGVDWQLSAVS